MVYFMILLFFFTLIMSIHEFVITSNSKYLPNKFLKDLNKKSCFYKNSTPLILALHLGKLQLANDILIKGADVAICNDFGNALHYAMGSHCNRDLDLIYKLLDKYLENGGDINLTDNLTNSSYLCYAMNYSFELCDYLLDKVIGVEISNEGNYNSLHHCCSLSYTNFAIIDGLSGEGIESLPDINQYGVFLRSTPI